MHRNKKLYIAISLVIIAVIVAYLTYLYWSREQTITRFYSNDPSKIDKIEYVSGSDGRLRTITASADLNKITAVLSTATFKRTPKGPDSTGWSYHIKVYEGNEIVFDLLQGNGEFIDDVHYTMSTSERDTLYDVLAEITAKLPAKEEVGVQ
ncbi:MAG: hypothetical protein Q4F05_09935 [bacterium]|nr:hypothetical protein [bacterium]